MEEKKGFFKRLVEGLTKTRNRRDFQWIFQYR